MSDKELVEEIHSCLSGSDMLEGILLCFELATDKPDKAAIIFTTYRPKFIAELHGWAREVNGHRGVFLPHSLFRSEAPRTYEEMREFETEYGGIIDVQAQASPHVQKHVDAANSMETERHAIIEAIERWRTDRELRKPYGTDDPERLTQIETIAVKIFEDKAKEEMRKTGIKVSDVDREKLTGLAIKAVKENKEFLEEALRQVRFRSRRIGQL